MDREEKYREMRLSQHIQQIPHSGGKPCPYCTGELLVEEECQKKVEEKSRLLLAEQKDMERLKWLQARFNREKVESEKRGYSVIETSFVPCQNYPQGLSFFEEGRRDPYRYLQERRPDDECPCFYYGRQETVCEFFLPPNYICDDGEFGDDDQNQDGMIDITGLCKGALLLCLAAGCIPKMYVTPTGFSPSKADLFKAKAAVKGGDVDYYLGRAIKTDLRRNRVDPWLYDRDAGQGKFAWIVEELKLLK